jgi:hypothetical protein
MRRKQSPRGAFPRFKRFTSRRAWRNHTGNQHIEPLRCERPTRLSDLVAIVKEAERDRVTVRAVGSGHSWSDVALTPGFLVETHGLHRELPVDCLRPDVDATLLVRTEAGVRLKELNARLEGQQLALSNMGGWDAQTIAGVMSTSTHGSGIGYGPMADQARAVDVVGSGGTIYRVERPDGPTDPGRFAAEHPDWTLVKDDQWFDSVIVGMGCLGIVYAVTLAVEPFYWLIEERHTRPWSKVRDDLRTREILYDNDHVEIYVNPHRRNGDNTCLITRRNRAPGPAKKWSQRHRNLFPETLSALQPVAPDLIDLAVNLRPKIAPWLLDTALNALVDPNYTDKWYRVMNLGTANLMPAYSMEIGVAIDDAEHHIAAVETVLEVAAQHAKLGAVYSTSPVSLRFVKRSPAYMSMMHGRDTVMLELIQLSRTEGGFELLAAYEEALYAVGGRPHWGQYNTLTGSHELMQSMYPRYRDWLAVHDKLNASGVFNGPFSKRVGISRSRYSGP